MIKYPVGITLSQYQLAIYTWIKNRLSLTIDPGAIIWRNQSEPLPPRPCVTMKIIDGPSRVGYSDNLVFIGGTSGSQFMVGGQRTMTVSIQIFGNTQVHRPMAYQLAIDLNSSLFLETVLQDLRKAGIGVLEQGSPNNLTALEETEYEERAQFDITISLAQNIVDDPGIITTVTPPTGTIHGGS